MPIGSAAKQTLVIAEAGVNHNGSVERAIELVRVAAECGADAVKFQTFKAARLATAAAKQSDYQRRNIGQAETQLAMLTRLELSERDHGRVLDACGAAGIEFMSTPFDHDSADFLVNGLGVARLKVGSGDLTNGPLLLHLARHGRPIILSTGMSIMGEVEQALAVLAFGFVAGRDERPGAEAFVAAYCSREGREALAGRVTLLHCTTEYPAPESSVNLRVMDSLAQAFEVPVGYSDHTRGIAVSIAAVARGAVAIEKHFTLDRNLPGPDHKASLEPDELGAMVQGIRQVEQAVGGGRKAPDPAEVPNLAVARKCVVAARAIAAGEVFDAANLDIKRAGAGLSPMAYWSLLGRPAPRAFAPDEPVCP